MPGEIQQASRFVRTTKPMPLIHYCGKRGHRVYFSNCEKWQCPHFRPLREPGDGSCAFVRRKKKAKEAEKRAEAKKNGNKPEVLGGDFAESFEEVEI